MRILAVSLDYIGHASGIHGWLRHAAGRGHSYSFLLPRRPGVRLRALLGGVRIFSLGLAAGEEAPDFAAVYRSPDMLRSLMRGVTGFDSPVVDAVERLLRSARVDVVVVDGTVAWAVIAAARAKIPCVSVPAGFAPFFTVRRGPEFDVAEELKPERDEVFAGYGVAPHHWVQNYVASPLMNIVMSTRAFLGARAPRVPFPFCLSGPLLCEDFGQLAGKIVPPSLPAAPFVFLSLGTVATGAIALRAVRLVAAACRRLGIPCVVARGNLPAGEELDALVFEFVPQEAFLVRCAVFVSSAGMNSVNGALLAGVPILALPLYFDQYDSAELVQESGVGLTLAVETVGVEEAQAALDRLLRDDRFRHAARVVGDSFRRLDGVEAAFGAIEGATI